MVIYRSKDKNTTQGNLGELVGSPVTTIGVSSSPAFFRGVHSWLVTIILRNGHGQSFGKLTVFLEEPIWGEG